VVYAYVYVDFNTW